VQLPQSVLSRGTPARCLLHGVVSSSALAAAGRKPAGWQARAHAALHCTGPQVLRWYAYWQEVVPGSPVEAWRVRNCNLHFFLEDGSLEVVEPRTDNSGLHQGKVLHRQRWGCWQQSRGRLARP